LVGLVVWVGAAGLPSFSTCGLRLGRWVRWWSAGGGGGWSAAGGEQGGPGAVPWPCLREVQGETAGAGGDSGRHVDDFASDGGGGGSGQCRGRAGAGGGGSGEVERDDGEDEPGRVRPELPGWQVSQCGVFQVGVDLFDDGVAAVDG